MAYYSLTSPQYLYPIFCIVKELNLLSKTNLNTWNYEMHRNFRYLSGEKQILKQSEN